jgi:type IV pilus assembly protein PilM
MRRAAGKPVTGLDVEPGYVTAVETAGGGVAVQRAAAAPLAAGVVREGEVLDVDGLAAALSGLFERHKLSRRVRLGLANQGIVMRTIELPPLRDPKELASAVRFQAQDHIPMPLDQVVLEHQSLGIVETPEGPRARVVLVAARRDMVERLLEATRQAGLRPEGVDLSAFAMIRALHRREPGPEVGSTLYLSIGGVTNLAIATGTLCVFTRVVSVGTESMATELAERRALTLEHARAWLRHVGLSRPVGEVEGQPEIVSEARRVLLDGASRIVDEVRNTLDFHTTQAGVSAVGRVVATGPGLGTPGFDERLRHGVGLPVETGRVAEAHSGAFGDLDAERLAVAAGLTVTEVPA